jgi:DNA modification methylase
MDLNQKAHTERLELITIDKLIPYANNARTHSEEQIKKIQASLREFGFVNPVLIDKSYGIIAGHGRVEAAKREGMAEVPCVWVEHLTEAQKKAYILADNKLAELAGWDLDLAELELKSLLDENFNIEITGFGYDDIAEVPEITEDDFDFEYVTAGTASIVQSGETWELGQHRLYCGDSTSERDVEALMNGEICNLLFTSPPYSDMREYKGDKNLDVCHLRKFIEVYDAYARIQVVNLGIQRADHAIVRYWDKYIEQAESIGLKLLAWNVWDKLMAGSIGQQGAMIPIRHEWLFVFGRNPVEINRTWEKQANSITRDGGTRAVRQADGTMKDSSKGRTNGKYKKMESVYKYEYITSVTEGHAELGEIRSKHPATFPVHLPSEYIVAFTKKGDGVIEPFGGAGTTLIACEELGRKCYCMELDPKYCDVIIDRWEQFTGEKAVKL